MVAALDAVGQTRNPNLEHAQKILEELKYTEAARSLEAAWATPGNDRETVLEILKLQAVVAATVGQTDRARTFFRSLLYLAPDFDLQEGDLGPKTMSLYYEAKGRVTADNVLVFERLPTEKDAVTVRRISVRVKSDPLKLGLTVRFHARVVKSQWEVKDSPLVENSASVVVGGAAVAWWAELLGEKDRTLARVGSLDQPIVDSTPAATQAPPAPAAAVSRPREPLNLRPLSYGLAGAGALAAVTGLIFGISSNNAKGELDAAARDSAGRITGITRVQGLALDDRVRTRATVADTLFVTAVALVGTGALLFYVSRDVKVGVSPAGVAIAGSLP